MAGQETRMLLLGAVSLFEPVNGYQIRRELLSWQVDRWAHTNPGSIYHGLTALTREKYVVRHNLRDGHRAVAVYEMTDRGREELDRLMTHALETVDAFDRAPFSVAFSMLPLLDKRAVLRCLTRRRVELEKTVAEFGSTEPGMAPPHAERGVLLWLDLAVAELAWLREVIDDIAAGTLPFRAGDPAAGWTPPADDPGWQMEADRRKYLSLLGR